MCVREHQTAVRERERQTAVRETERQTAVRVRVRASDCCERESAIETARTRGRERYRKRKTEGESTAFKELRVLG